eukprot:GILI01000166.1.p2 GENE.GILI01000166.1~~GILI01000166.1.p2  ORF type:complete len:189 (-),score=66.30 GILI01000166.1:77-643(-)
MKTIVANQFITVPEGITVEINSRNVVVKGKRGSLSKNFRHIPVDMQLLAKGRKIKVEAWFGDRAHMACIRTVCTHIQNMFNGVTKGFQYKMRLVYAHFPINVNITEADTCIEIRNFLGEKVVRKVQMHPGVKIVRSAKVKDELVLEGNDLEKVSLSAATVQQSTRVRNKDIRKFLDGIYVSERGFIQE